MEQTVGVGINRDVTTVGERTVVGVSGDRTPKGGGDALIGQAMLYAIRIKNLIIDI